MDEYNWGRRKAKDSSENGLNIIGRYGWGRVRDEERWCEGAYVGVVGK